MNRKQASKKTNVEEEGRAVVLCVGCCRVCVGPSEWVGTSKSLSCVCEDCV